VALGLTALSGVFASPPPRSSPLPRVTRDEPHDPIVSAKRGTAPVRAATSSSSSSSSRTSTSTTVPSTTTLPLRSRVLVEVLNGSGQGGEAASVAVALHQAGFLINGTGNAASFLHPETLVLYPPGNEPAAKVLAADVAGETELEPSTSVPAGVVDLVLGDTFRGVVGEATSPIETTGATG